MEGKPLHGVPKWRDRPYGSALSSVTSIFLAVSTLSSHTETVRYIFSSHRPVKNDAKNMQFTSFSQGI